MEFGLLGRLDVRDGATVLPVPSGKQRAILAVLLLRIGQVASMDELAELIWAGNPPRSARVTLYNHVRRLRQLLATVGRAPLRTDGSGYLIEEAPDHLDVTRFRTLCDSGRRAADREDWPAASQQLSAALSLWRGEPLADIPCPALADAEVPHLTSLRVAALEDRIDADLRLGRHRQVLPELERLAEAEPLREQVQVLLMLALYRAGRQAQALAVYQRARTALVTGLGIEPGTGLRRIHYDILNADPSLELSRGRAATVSGGQV
jgi:DNA-binding SARP family transcriptional activator